METAVHHWGRLYDPPGYVCRNCSFAIAETEIRLIFGVGAVDHGADLDKMIDRLLNGNGAVVQGTRRIISGTFCPNDKPFTAEPV